MDDLTTAREPELGPPTEPIDMRAIWALFASEVAQPAAPAAGR